MRARATAAGCTALLLTGVLPAGATAAPALITTVDGITASFEDPERTRPALVSWRTTGEVENDTPLPVLDDLEGTGVVERSQLGGDVSPTYPVAKHLSWHTPYCESGAAWRHHSRFIGRGHSWVGIPASKVDLAGYRQSNAADGSKLQWAEVAVGGVNRFPPRPANPGGEVRSRLLGTAEQRVEWFDPTESCFVGGVRRVVQDVSFSVAAIEAVGGDVTFGGNDELPVFSIPTAGDRIDQVRGSMFYFEGLPGLLEGAPDLAIDADVILTSDENGANPRLDIHPYVTGPGRLPEAVRTPTGTDWQLRFMVATWTETIDFGSEMGTLSMTPGQRVTVVTHGEGADRVRRFRAEVPSELRVGQDGAEVVALGHEPSPFPDLNSCGLDEPKQGFPVAAPAPPVDPGDGVSIRSPGLGEPDLPFHVPPGWTGFNLGTDAQGGVSFEDVTVGGQTFGEVAMPFVLVDGTAHRVTPASVVEGPVVLGRQYGSGGMAGGIGWDSVMVAMVVRAGGVDVPVYWQLHSKVMGDSRGIGGCSYLRPEVGPVTNPGGKDVRLVWFVRANLGGRPRTLARAWEGLEGWRTVATERTFSPILGVIGGDNFLGFQDKDNPELRFGIQRWDGAGPISLVLHHGTKAADPGAEVNGEGIDGADLVWYMAQQLGTGRWEGSPYAFYPCGPCADF